MIAKQSGEIVESVRKKKREATVGRICRKGKFSAWNERVRGVIDDESGESMEPMEEMPLVRPGQSEMERLECA